MATACMVLRREPEIRWTLHMAHPATMAESVVSLHATLFATYHHDEERSGAALRQPNHNGRTRLLTVCFIACSTIL